MDSSGTAVVERFVAAVTGRDFDRQRELLAPAVRFRALTPPGLRTADTAEETVGWLRRWLGNADRVRPAASATGPVVDRYRLTWRLRLREGGRWYDVDQCAYVTVRAGRITELDLLCSGFRPLPTTEGDSHDDSA
jgi:SnoaL-like protein